MCHKTGFSAVEKSFQREAGLSEDLQKVNPNRKRLARALPRRFDRSQPGIGTSSPYRASIFVRSRMYRLAARKCTRATACGSCASLPPRA